MHCFYNNETEYISCGFTNDELVEFPFDPQSIAKQIADECSCHIVVRNTTFKDYISRGERFGKYICYKEKNIRKLYNFK